MDVRVMSARTLTAGLQSMDTACARPGPSPQLRSRHLPCGARGLAGAAGPCAWRACARRPARPLRQLHALQDDKAPSASAAPPVLDSSSTAGSGGSSGSGASSAVSAAVGGTAQRSQEEEDRLREEAERLADEALTEAVMERTFAELKVKLKASLSPEESELVDSIQYEEMLDAPKLLKRLARDQLGPVLEQAGVTEEPMDFLIDVLRRVAALQLLTAAVTFYATELGAHFDAGEAFRCVCGLGLGYATRPFLRLERLLGPVYAAMEDLLAQMMGAPVSGAEWLSACTPDQRQEAVNSVALTLALVLIVPQVVLGWHTQESLQLGVPLSAGWLLTDVLFFVALAQKVL